MREEKWNSNNWDMESKERLKKVIKIMKMLKLV